MALYPKISIITPSLNQGHFIEETICSVLDQRYPNLEYIIIDGSSTDNTVEVIKKYEKHLTYWVSEKDSGQSDAINKGIQKATGEIVNWLNSDDYYEPGALMKVGEAFKNPGTNVYCGISRIFGGDKEYFSAGTDIYAGDLAKTIGWARIDQPETFFRKSVWYELGDLDLQFHYLMDREFWIRYLLRYGIGHIHKSEELLVHFRLHPNSKTVSQQEGFKREGLNYFYSLALLAGLQKESTVIGDYWPCEILPLKNIIPAIDIRTIVHNYFWYHIAEAYAMNDRERFDYFVNHLDITQLSRTEQQKCRRLILRQRVVPQKLKKLWNKMKQK